jgi:hypothetical protein
MKRGAEDARKARAADNETRGRDGAHRAARIDRPDNRATEQKKTGLPAGRKGLPVCLL